MQSGKKNDDEKIYNSYIGENKGIAFLKTRVVKKYNNDCYSLTFGNLLMNFDGTGRFPFRLDKTHNKVCTT